MIFNENNLAPGQHILITGDASEWKILEVIDHMLQVTAENIKTGDIGPVPFCNIREIINVAKATIKSDQIELFDVPPAKMDAAKKTKKPTVKKTTSTIKLDDIKMMDTPPKKKRGRRSKDQN